MSAETVDAPKTKPTHYRVVCFSLYIRDLDALDTVVRLLRERGFTKANKSWALRIALEHLALGELSDAEIGAVP